MRIPGLGINTNEVALASEHELGPWTYRSNRGRETDGLVGVYSLGRFDGHEKLPQRPLQAKVKLYDLWSIQRHPHTPPQERTNSTIRHISL